ncbi:carboxysome peptide B [Pelomicrobium sp.]|jgi:carboxysome peptide B|uniref:carboxysome peptide B n=1 Tax=Pelomicrobium sp. TaxID=2815319 RepID=UPI002FDE708A
MQIHRVVRDLVTTKRTFWLAAKSLRVVEDDKGNLEVALDPIGCKPGDFVITIGVSAARIAAGNPMITTDLTIGGIIDHWSEEEWRS